MIEYHKIETLFKREETGKHKLLIGEYRNPTVEMCKDLSWVYTEKIDGTNIRIYWDGHKLSFGGRTDNAQLHSQLVQFLVSKTSTSEIEQIFEQRYGLKEVYVYGEGYGAGIQTGGGYKKDKGLILFDLQIANRFQPYEAVVEMAGTLGVEVVPQVLTGTIQDGIDWVLSHEISTIGDGTAKCEGIVGRLKNEMYDGYGNRMIIKIRREDFVK